MDDGKGEASLWGQPNYLLRLRIGTDDPILFADMKGFADEQPVIKVRHSTSPVFGVEEMPSRPNTKSVTMERGIVANAPQVQDWVTSASTRKIIWPSAEIEMLHKDGLVQVRWTLVNVYPAHFRMGDWRSDTSEWKIDSLELRCDSFSVETFSSGEI